MLEVGWSLRNLSQSYLKKYGWVKSEIVSRGKGVFKVSPSLTPNIIIVHYALLYSVGNYIH